MRVRVVRDAPHDKDGASCDASCGKRNGSIASRSRAARWGRENTGIKREGTDGNTNEILVCYCCFGERSGRERGDYVLLLQLLLSRKTRTPDFDCGERGVGR